MNIFKYILLLNLVQGNFDPISSYFRQHYSGAGTETDAKRYQGKLYQGWEMGRAPAKIRTIFLDDALKQRARPEITVSHFLNCLLFAWNTECPVR